ncbi:hypothetical protein ABB37_04820 [Leptomonas pyrrhocoris]|uniref:DNA replication complex GINS protein SLD5 n=1 Tax=Leptomonas pyrrhocoris TaxID=157538 RepID=A0A0M9G247_LEPPY|nr:hypothetical protein ABB37_04820 [Leptomonas pyrrhocoris]KPA80629.1 hypothetical protein ABB37_04820 [Leptomonas pyrrhocoris]|eukprot:XP_015659068.1 hypothetical protein ABB37_04820 [Leptomonas pyrrhocoris]
MFFEDNLNDTLEDESLLHDGDGPVQPLSQASDGGASSGAPSLGRSGTSLPFDGSFLSGVAATPIGNGSGVPNTAAAAIQLLMEATSNERFSPEVLPYPASTVNAVTGLLRTMQQRVARRVEEEKRTQARSLLPFRPSDIMHLELQRIQFFLCELLRCRLRKINQLCLSLWYEGQAAQQRQRRSATAAAEDEEGTAAAAASSSLLPEVSVPQRRNLSPREVFVADRLAETVHRAVLESGLQSAPAPLQHLVPHPPDAEGLEVLSEPNLGAYVFGVALEDLGVVNLGEGVQDASRAINAGELFLTPYHNFRPFVMSGQVRLV